MQLDKKAIDRLLLLDDSSLWGVIRMIASQSGMSLPDKMEKGEIAAIRRALGSATDADIAAAGDIIKKIKEQNGG